MYFRSDILTNCINGPILLGTNVQECTVFLLVTYNKLCLHTHIRVIKEGMARSYKTTV